MLFVCEDIMDYSEEEFDLKELKSSCVRRFEMFAKCRMKMCERRNVPSLAFRRDVFMVGRMVKTG